MELNRLANDVFGGTDYFPAEYFIEKSKITEGEHFTFGGFGTIHRGTMHSTGKWINVAQKQTPHVSDVKEERDAGGVSKERSHRIQLDICIKKVIAKKVFVDEEASFIAINTVSNLRYACDRLMVILGRCFYMSFGHG